MTKTTKLIICSLILILGLFFAYYFSHKNKTIEVVSEVPASDQFCQVDADCTVAMVECSCDCGIPINKIHRQKYVDEHERKCKSYSGVMCKISCEQELKCVNNICTNIKTK